MASDALEALDPPAASGLNPPMASLQTSSPPRLGPSVPSTAAPRAPPLNTADLAEIESGDTTPRASFSSNDCTSPHVPIRRVSGRQTRPLSIISNSSLNSDLSSPGAVSPGKHRRHRSVLAASIDYRMHGYEHYPPPPPQQHQVYTPHHAYPPHLAYNPNTAYTSQPSYAAAQCTTPLGHAYSSNATTPTPGQYAQVAMPYGHPHSPTAPVYSAGYAYMSGTPSVGTGLTGYAGTQFNGGAYAGGAPSAGDAGFPLTPPLDTGTFSPIARVPAPAPDPFKEMLNDLAYKERQVLEARQIWESANADLEAFRHQFRAHLDAILGPVPTQISVPLRPSIITRRFTPNVGIRALSYTLRRPEVAARDRIVSWRVDSQVPVAEDPNMDELSDDDLVLHTRDGIALRVVKLLLRIVHCIVMTLPVEQRQYSYQQAQISWSPDYPTPMETFFGHFAYEA